MPRISKAIAGVVLTLGLTAPVTAADDPDGPDLFREAGDLTVEQFKWEYRPLLIFADSAADPRFRRQMEALEARPDELADRDVIVITDADPAANSPLRRQFRPHDFMLVLVGKDGQIKLRKPQPWDVREISRSIDKTPLRQQEIRDRRAERGAQAVADEPAGAPAQ